MSADLLDDIPADEAPIVAKRIKSNFVYYRQPNGYITVDVVSPMERLAYTEEGWVCLKEYGAFDMTTEYAVNHPFEALFMRNGAKEMSKKQVIELGFNIHPPMIPRCGRVLSSAHKRHTGDEGCWPGRFVSFPQITEDDMKSYPCSFDGCNRSYEEEAFPTLAGRNQHERVAHKEEKAAMSSGEVLATSIVSGLKDALGQAAISPALIKELALTPEQQKALRDAGLIGAR